MLLSATLKPGIAWHHCLLVRVLPSPAKNGREKYGFGGISA